MHSTAFTYITAGTNPEQEQIWIGFKNYPLTTRWTEKFRAHRFPECFPIFQYHRTSSLGMCGLLLPSWPSPSSLHLKGQAATVSLRPIFAIAGAFASSGFSYCPGSLRAKLVAIATTAAAASSLAA